MRKYERIWDTIKKDLEISLKAPVSSHQRIIQAVRKERSNDDAWNFLRVEAGKRYLLDYKIKGKVITFSLVDNTPLSVEDL